MGLSRENAIMETPNPKGMTSPSYHERLHTPKSMRRELRKQAMPVDKGCGAANRSRPVNCYGKARPDTPLEAARILVQCKGIKPKEGYTYDQMVNDVAGVLEGLSKRALARASGWKNVKHTRQSIKRIKIMPKKEKRELAPAGAFCEAGPVKDIKDLGFMHRLEAIREKDARRQDGRILTRSERRH